MEQIMQWDYQQRSVLRWLLLFQDLCACELERQGTIEYLANAQDNLSLYHLTCNRESRSKRNNDYACNRQKSHELWIDVIMSYIVTRQVTEQEWMLLTSSAINACERNTRREVKKTNSILSQSQHVLESDETNAVRNVIVLDWQNLAITDKVVIALCRSLTKLCNHIICSCKKREKQEQQEYELREEAAAAVASTLSQVKHHHQQERPYSFIILLNDNVITDATFPALQELLLVPVLSLERDLETSHVKLPMVHFGIIDLRNTLLSDSCLRRLHHLHNSPNELKVSSCCQCLISNYRITVHIMTCSANKTNTCISTSSNSVNNNNNTCLNNNNNNNKNIIFCNDNGDNNNNANKISLNDNESQANKNSTAFSVAVQILQWVEHVVDEQKVHRQPQWQTSNYETESYTDKERYYLNKCQQVRMLKSGSTSPIPQEPAVEQTRHVTLCNAVPFLTNADSKQNNKIQGNNDKVTWSTEHFTDKELNSVHITVNTSALAARKALLFGEATENTNNHNESEETEKHESNTHNIRCVKESDRKVTINKSAKSASPLSDESTYPAIHIEPHADDWFMQRSHNTSISPSPFIHERSQSIGPQSCNKSVSCTDTNTNKNVLPEELLTTSTTATTSVNEIHPYANSEIAPEVKCVNNRAYHKRETCSEASESCAVNALCNSINNNGKDKDQCANTTYMSKQNNRNTLIKSYNYETSNNYSTHSTTRPRSTQKCNKTSFLSSASTTLEQQELQSEEEEEEQEEESLTRISSSTLISTYEEGQSLHKENQIYTANDREKSLSHNVIKNRALPAVITSNNTKTPRQQSKCNMHEPIATINDNTNHYSTSSSDTSSYRSSSSNGSEMEELDLPHYVYAQKANNYNKLNRVKGNACIKHDEVIDASCSILNLSSIVEKDGHTLKMEYDIYNNEKESVYYTDDNIDAVDVVVDEKDSNTNVKVLTRHTIWDVLEAYCDVQASTAQADTSRETPPATAAAESCKTLRMTSKQMEKCKINQGASINIPDAPSLPFHALTTLIMRHNHLRSLKCNALPITLVKLDVSCNRLTSLHGVETCTHLQLLNARRNALTAIPHLVHLMELTHLFLGRNSIRVIDNLSYLKRLHTLDISFNALGSTNAIRTLSLIVNLRCLYIKGNSLITKVLKQHRYKAHLRQLCPSLNCIDDVFIAASNVAAIATNTKCASTSQSEELESWRESEERASSSLLWIPPRRTYRNNRTYEEVQMHKCNINVTQTNITKHNKTSKEHYKGGKSSIQAQEQAKNNYNDPYNIICDNRNSNEDNDDDKWADNITFHKGQYQSKENNSNKSAEQILERYILRPAHKSSKTIPYKINKAFELKKANSLRKIQNFQEEELECESEPLEEEEMEQEQSEQQEQQIYEECETFSNENNKNIRWSTGKKSNNKLCANGNGVYAWQTPQSTEHLQGEPLMLHANNDFAANVRSWLHKEEEEEEEQEEQENHREENSNREAFELVQLSPIIATQTQKSNHMLSKRAQSLENTRQVKNVPSTWLNPYATSVKSVTDDDSNKLDYTKAMTINKNNNREIRLGNAVTDDSKTFHDNYVANSLPLNTIRNCKNVQSRSDNYFNCANGAKEHEEEKYWRNSSLHSELHKDEGNKYSNSDTRTLPTRADDKNRKWSTTLLSPSLN